jgi:hypothetical protein
MPPTLENAGLSRQKRLPAGILLAKTGAGAWLQYSTYCSFSGNEENWESSFEMLKLGLK